MANVKVRPRHSARGTYLCVKVAALTFLAAFFLICVWVTFWFVNNADKIANEDEADVRGRQWARQVLALRGGGTTAAPTPVAKNTSHANISDTAEMNAWRDMQLPDDWFECIRDNLQLDAEGRPRFPVTDMMSAIPLLITPLTGDAKFFPYFVCSLGVSVRYHYVVQNERDPETVRVVDELQRRFGSSGRLIIQRNHHNRGYSGSMNQGFTWALTERSEAEVPWVFACGVDVIFGPGLLVEMIAMVQRAVKADGPMLAALREEVALEERLILEGNTSYYDLWAPKGRPLKVLRSGFPGVPANVHTASLLPDRVRHLVEDENREDGRVSQAELRRRFFGEHVATVVPVSYALGTIAITRLALSAGGFFDENFFPAYMDDIDLQWRYYSLGFRARVASFDLSAYHHYNAANMRQGGFSESTAQQFGTEDNYSKFAFHNYLRRGDGHYGLLKYGPRDRKGVWEQAPVGAQYTHMYFNVSHYPVDTWVSDEGMRRCMFRKTYHYATDTWTRPIICRYNSSTLAESGVLGTEQWEQFQALRERMLYAR